MKRSIVLLLCMGFLALSSACAQQNSQNPARSRFPLTVGQKVFQVEAARTDAQRQLGLMFRTSMAENEGMIFIFDTEEHLSFWMKNTKIPLSVAYISTSGQIKEIFDMEPESLKSVDGQHFALYALEVNKGAFEREGIKVGDFIRLTDIPPGK